MADGGGDEGDGVEGLEGGGDEDEAEHQGATEKVGQSRTPRLEVHPTKTRRRGRGGGGQGEGDDDQETLVEEW